MWYNLDGRKEKKKERTGKQTKTEIIPNISVITITII